MKKKLLFIIPGILILMMVLGVWLYLMFYGVPADQNDVFSDLGFTTENTNEPAFIAENPEPIIITENPNVTPESLRQLTVRPVAGMALIIRDGVTRIRYVEQGTAHVYEINTDGNNEERISATTIPRVTSAIFSPNGGHVVLVKEEFRGADVLLGTLEFDSTNERKLTTHDLPANITNITFSEESEQVRFTISDQNGSRGYSEDVVSGDRTLLFDIPLMSIKMIWDNDAEYYVYTKPASGLEGFIYRLKNGELLRATRGGQGLTAITNQEYIVRSTNDSSGTPVSEAVSISSNTAVTLPVPFLPEKCDFDSSDPATLWCAASFTTPTDNYPDDWYRGTVSYSDALWKIDIERQEAVLQSDFAAISGRTIDTEKLEHRSNLVLFINRLDGTLWLFDTTL